MSYKTICLFAIVVLLGACNKVGEDDPSLSLRTRDTKIVGTWKLTSASAESEATRLTESENTTTRTVTKASQELNGSTATLNSNTDKLTIIDFDDLLFESKDGSGSRKTVHNVTTMEITLYEDHTYGVSYQYSKTSGESCSTRAIGGKDTVICATDDLIVGEEIVNNNLYGQWYWDEDGRMDKIGIELVPYSGEPDASGHDLALFTGLMEGPITKLSNNEMVFTRTSSIDNSSSDNDGSISTASVATNTQTWEKIEKKPSRTE